MKRVLREEVPVVVSSCDRYADLWRPFFTLFFRYWPGCPFPVYLLANRLQYVDPRVKTIKLGKDRGWSTNIKAALQQIRCPYFLYLQEDYFLQRRVETKQIIESIDCIQTNEDIGCIKLYPAPPPNRPFLDRSELGEISHDAAYRVSLQAAIWRTDFFLMLLKEGETGRQMEIKGTERSRGLPHRILSVKRGQALLPYYFRTAVKKSKWYPGIIRWCRRQGIDINPGQRRVLSNWQVVTGDIKRYLASFIKHL